MDQTAFSRSDHSSPLGGRTAKMQTMVPEETKLLAGKLWHSAGYGSESEWLADVVIQIVHGKDVVARLHLERLQKALGKGAE